MVRHLFSFVLFVGVLACTQPLIAQYAGKVYTVAEEPPTFPGGPLALRDYLAEHITYPNQLLRKNIDPGPVTAKFIIDEAGQVSDIRVVVKPLHKEAKKGMQEYMASIINAIEKMPRWNPGEVNRRPVAVYYSLPIDVGKPR